jgi:GntR family transcriptional regulator, transcriptional repressor for pyruvate dehydrogenase complex
MSVEFEQILIEPAYRKVAAAISGRILSRSLREGDRLPPEMELARQFGVNRSTVREALRELESSGLVSRRAGSRRMSVSRPEHVSIAEGVSRALVLHDVTFLEVWEALTLIEPPLAQLAARERSAADLAALREVGRQFSADHRDSQQAVHAAASFFRGIGRAAHNQVLEWAQEPLLRLLEPSLLVMIDRVAQARERIRVAQRHICAAVEARDTEAAGTWMARHVRDFRKGFELAHIDLRGTLTRPSD